LEIIHKREIKICRPLAPFLIKRWFEDEGNVKSMGKVTDEEQQLIERRIKSVVPTVKDVGEYVDIVEFVHAWDFNIRAMSLGVHRTWGTV
jgi:hypothetical protein